MRRIQLIGTGGTIACLPSNNGLTPKLTANNLLDFLDIDISNIECVDVFNMDSSNIQPEEWCSLASAINRAATDFDAIVVTHGTDTMAYTASALSFMLKNLNKPVILTGSQIPLCEVRSDGRDNLITSLMIAGEGKVREVCIYFGGLLLRGSRATKDSADGMQAFRSPNCPPLASAGIAIQYQDVFYPNVRSGKFECVPFSNVPIGVIKVFPGIRFDLFEPIITSQLKGVVVEAFGSGNVPDEGEVLLPILEKAKSSGTVIVVCSQCPQSTVNMSAYEAGSILKRAGAVSGMDMTTEAAVAKLYYLFSICDDPELIKFHMERNIRGELTGSEDI